MVNENSYVSIQAFMVNELHLKGNELIVYAVIFGYTQDGEHWYYGTRAHLAEWCGATKGTVSNCLRSLVEKGLIVRREVERYGCTQVQYQAVQNTDTGVTKIDTGGDNFCDTPLPNFSTIDNKETYASKHSSNKGFTPPKPEEVREYMKERGTPIDAEAFCNYYTSVGWMRGKTKMKDWKAAARGWYSREQKWSKGKGVKWDAELQEYAGELGF